MQTILKRIPEKPFTIAVFSILFLVMVWAVFTFLREPIEQPWYPGNRSFVIGVDWKMGFRPAALAILSGKSPYSAPVFNPPWIFIPFIPIALLPSSLGTAVMFVLGFFMPGLAIARMGAKPLATAAFVLSPLVMLNAQNCNIDWMVMLGITLPPQLGLFFVLAKPQIGIGIALFWLIQAWNRGKLREVFRVFGPAGLTLMASFLVFGPYLLRNYAVLTNHELNASLWPIGLLIGIAILIYAIRNRNKSLAVISSPFLTPYLLDHSWAVSQFGLAASPLEFWAVWIMLWFMRLGLHMI